MQTKLSQTEWEEIFFSRLVTTSTHTSKQKPMRCNKLKLMIKCKKLQFLEWPLEASSKRKKKHVSTFTNNQSGLWRGNLLGFGGGLTQMNEISGLVR